MAIGPVDVTLISPLKFGIKNVFQFAVPATGIAVGFVITPSILEFTIIFESGVVVEAIMVIPPVKSVPAMFLISGMLSIKSGSKQFTGAIKFIPAVWVPVAPAKHW